MVHLSALVNIFSLLQVSFARNLTGKMQICPGNERFHEILEAIRSDNIYQNYAVYL